MNNSKRKKLYRINLSKKSVEGTKTEEIQEVKAVEVVVPEAVVAKEQQELPVGLKEIPEEQSEKVVADKKKPKFKKSVEEEGQSDV